MHPEKTSILFVDDDSSLRASFRRLLHRFRDDWQMGFCSSGEEALRHLEQNHVDVVVSDIRMPNMDGTELLQAVAQNHPGVIRFILSGQAEKETILKLVDNVHQYFAKPCNPSKLFDAVSAIMTKRQRINSAEIAHQLTSLTSIPIARQSYEALQLELELNQPDMNRIVKIVRSDVGLAMKVLKLVSTSFFGTPQPGCDLSLACRTLGIDLLRSVLIKAGASQSTPSERQEAGSRTCELYQPLTNSWQVLQHSGDLTKEPDDNTTATFDCLASLWGVHDSSVYGQNERDKGHTK